MTRPLFGPGSLKQQVEFPTWPEEDAVFPHVLPEAATKK